MGCHIPVCRVRGGSVHWRRQSGEMAGGTQNWAIESLYCISFTQPPKCPRNGSLEAAIPLLKSKRRENTSGGNVLSIALTQPLLFWRNRLTGGGNPISDVHVEEQRRLPDPEPEPWPAWVPFWSSLGLRPPELSTCVSNMDSQKYVTLLKLRTELKTNFSILGSIFLEIFCVKNFELP